MVIRIMDNTSTVTSTSFKIKDLLLRAWRERWSEIEWGRNIKRLLRGVSGDVYDLADCMLRQAINGPVTNTLLMHYLNHCLDSQIISLGACIMAITKIPELKAHCINSLLDFLLRYKTRTNCYGNDDECLALCRALVAFIHWLYTIIQNSLNELNDYSSVNEFLSNNQSMLNGESIHWQILDKATQMLRYIGNCSYLKALLYIGQMEENTLWKQWQNLHQELVSKLFILSNVSNIDKKYIEQYIDTLETFQNNIQRLSIKKSFKSEESQNGQMTYRPLSYHSIRLSISFYAILDPSCSNELIANYLAIIGRTFDLSLSRLYCETLHTCLVGLIDTHSLANEDRKNINYHAWIAFLLFKIPQIFLKLSQHRIQLRKECSTNWLNIDEQANQQDEKCTKNDLEIGIEQLFRFGPCIDQFLLRYKTEHIQKLLDCFKESPIGLLSDNAVDRYMKEINKRILFSSSECLLDGEQHLPIGNGGQLVTSCQSGSDALSSNILIFRAEHTVKSILTPLYMDTCNLEAVAGIMFRMQHSFDIILCAAASNGMLPKFAQRLLELNRTNINSRQESVRNSQIRAVVFDLTFISLCSLVEHYGSEAIEQNQQLNKANGSNGFFANWSRWNLPSCNSCYAPEIILSSYAEHNKYEHLLSQLIISNSQSVELKTAFVSWDDMCIAAQLATSQVLKAWCEQAITQELVKTFLERLKSRLCFLSLSAGCWLFAKLSTVSDEHQKKVLFMLDELQTPSIQMESNSTETFVQEPSESNLSFGYKQRFLLMSTTLKRLLAKYVPHSKLTNKSLSMSQPIAMSKSAINVLLKQSLSMSRNHFTLKLIYDFDGLLQLAGAEWFTKQVVKYLFHFNDVACLQDSVDLAYGLFHLDLEQCALTLLKHVLPQFLMSKSSELDLIEPKISSLIRLTVITTYSAIEQMDKLNQLNLSKRCGHRRNYQQISQLYPPGAFELSEWLLEQTPFYYKRRDRDSNESSRTNSNQIDGSIPSDPMDVDLDDKWICSDSVSKDYQWILKEPLYIELVHLFQFILQQSFEYEFSPWLLVPISLLEQIVLNLGDDSSQFLRFISFNLLEAIIQSSHCQRPTFEQLLTYLVLDSDRSRKIAAKLICQLQLAKEYVHLETTHVQQEHSHKQNDHMSDSWHDHLNHINKSFSTNST